MRAAAAVIGCLVVGLAWAGCSSTDNQPKGAGGSAGSSGHDGGSQDGGPRDPNQNCVKPGTPNNERGVGGYCESSADCVTDLGALFFCSADFEITPRYAWFCTTFCTFDSDCGSHAFCGQSDLGGGCVPNGCGAAPDGGGDASDDVASEATSDGAPEGAPDSSPEAAADGAPDVAPDVTPDVGADVPGDSPVEAASDGGTD